MIRIAISGIYGKTGSETALAAEKHDNFEIAFGVDKTAKHIGATVYNASGQKVVPVYKSFAEAKKAGERCDGIIDFSSPSALKDICDYAAKTKSFVLFATTGYSEKDKVVIKKLSESASVCLTENTSRGIAAVKKILPVICSSLPDFQTRITETHNKNKKDAPSGTAIALNDCLRKKTQIMSVREGDVVGIHTVSFTSEFEEISVTHKAFSRSVFANGALETAEKLYKKAPGFYNPEGEKTIAHKN